MCEKLYDVWQETWAVSAETERKLERTEMRMVRFMCGVGLRDKCTNSDLRNRLGIDSIVEAIRRSRLRWLGYVERKADEDWVRDVQIWKWRAEEDEEGLRERGWRWCRMICKD